MGDSRIEGNMHVAGNLSAEGFTPPAGSVTAAAIGANAKVETSKVRHRHERSFAESSLVTAAAKEQIVAVIWGAAGEIVNFEAGLHTMMTNGGGDDRQVTFDLKRWRAGVITSVLTGVITIDKTLNAKQAYPGTLNITSLLADDVLFVVMAVSGSVGTQGLGAFAHVRYDEDAN